MKWIAFFLLFASSILVVWGQPYSFLKVDINDGLSNNSVNCLLQDSEGMIWVGTADGLCRFDGRGFETLDTRYSEELANVSGVNSLYEDRNGDIWIGTTHAGVFRFSRTKRSIKQVEILGFKPIPEVNAIAQSKDGNYWIGFEKHPLCRLDRSLNTSYPFRENNIFRHNRIYRFFQDDDQQLLCGALGAALSIYTGNDWELIDSTGTEKLKVPTINAFESFNGNYYFGGWSNEVFRYDPNSGIEMAFRLESDSSNYSNFEINCIKAYKDQLWIGTKYSGLYLYSPSTAEVKRFRYSADQAFCLSSDEVRDIMIDDLGRIWFATSNGISIHDPEALNCRQIGLNTTNTSPENGLFVQCFEESEALLYIGTSAGLFVQKGDEQPKPILDFSESIYSLHSPNPDSLWVGTNRSLWLYLTKEQRFVGVKSHNYSLSDTLKSFSVFDLASSRFTSLASFTLNNRNVLIGSPFGYALFILNPANRCGSDVLFALKDYKFGSVDYENLIRKIYIDNNKRIWILGFSQGLFFGLEMEKSSLDIMLTDFGRPGINLIMPEGTTRYSNPEQWNFEGFPERAKTYDMVECGIDSFYVSTYGQGLYLITKEVGKWRASKIDCPFNSLEGLAIDGKSRLWALASGGLICYDQDAKSWTRFNHEDGLPKDGVNGYLFKRKDGRLVCAGLDGFVIVSPDEYESSSRAQEARISSLRINNVLSDSLIFNQPFTLSPEQRFISIDFGLMEFSKSMPERFSYRLLGYDSDWQVLTNSSSINYSDLRAGDYSFEVIACNKHGVWSTAPATLSFSIQPPFYLRVGFILVSALVLLSALVLIYYFRLRSDRLKQRQKLRIEVEARENERFRLAEDLHDDLGMKLSTAKLYLEALTPYTGDDSNALKIMGLTREMIDAGVVDLRSKLRDLSPVTLKKYGLVPALEELRNKINGAGNLQFNLTNHKSIPRLTVSLELSIYRIVQELINNSIKHSQCSRVDLELEFKKSVLGITYRDNGIGMQVKSKIEGFGMSNISHRVELENGQLSWDSPSEGGVRLRLIFPINENENHG